MRTRFIKLPVVMLFVAGILALADRDASALGIGAYGQIKNTWATVTADYIDPVPPLNDFIESSDATRIMYSFGFVLDTNVSIDSIFNYRLQLGIGFGTLSIDGRNYNDDIDLIEYSMYHSFGFGIIRSEKVRVWLGPQVGFGYASGKYSYAYESNKEYREVFVSLGAILGFNIHITNGISLGIAGGIRETILFAIGSASNDLFLDYTDPYAFEAFGDVSILFRFE